MKKLCLFVLCMAFVSVAFAQKVYQAQTVTKPVSTGSPYVPVVLEDSTSVYMSPAAVNAYNKDASKLKTFVKSTAKDGKQILVLPEEKKPVAASKQDAATNKLDQLDQALHQQASCGGNMDCEYLVKFWLNVEGWPKQKVDNYMASQKKLNYAHSLHDVKEACFNNSNACSKRNLIVLEREHMNQIAGPSHDYKALQKEISERPAKFTMLGLNHYLIYLCESAKKETWPKKEVSKLSAFAKDMQKKIDQDKSFVIPGKATESIGPGVNCISQL